MRARLALTLAIGWLLPGAASADPSVTIGGDSVCPSPAEVASRVSALLPDATPRPLPAARVDRVGSDLLVRLGDERGTSIAQRALPAAGTCAEMAEVVAVTITAWLGQLRPERVPNPELPSQLRARETPATPIALDVGAGAVVSWAEGGVAPGVRLLSFVHAGPGGPGVHVVASGTTKRDVDVGSRTAAWRRWAIGAGPSYQFLFGRWRLASGLGFSAGWLTAEGRDFPQNHSATRFSPGVEGVLRLARPFRWWSPWIAVGASAAYRREPLTVIGSAETRALQPIDLDVCLGISVGTFP